MKRQSALSVVLAATALAGVAGILVATPHGIGLTPDSVGYIGGARNLVDGRGFTMPPSGEPITHHAPLYPSLLAAVALVGPEPALGARWLAAAFFGLNIILMWGVASRTRTGMAAAPFWVPAAVTGLVLVAPTMWEIHLMAWTEPAYISLCLAGIWLTAAYLGNRQRMWLVAAAACIGLATLTRYAGLSMVGAGCLALLLFERQPMARRIADAAWFAVLGTGPFVLWTARNLLLAGTATSRSLVVHPIDADRLREALGTAASWLLVPQYAAGWTKVAAIAVAGAVLVTGFCLRLRASGGRMPDQSVRAIPDVVKVTLVAAIVYPLFLAVSLSLADANTPLDRRILSPMFVFLLVLAAFGLHCWDGVIGTRRARRSLAALFVGLVVLAYSWTSAPLIAESYRGGLGFSNRRWTDSRLVLAIRALPSSATVYSNSPDAVYYHGARGAKRIPTPFSRVTRSANPTYEQERTAMARDLEIGGVLVYFDLGTEPRPSHVQALIKEFELVSLQRYPDGEIYARSGAGLLPSRRP